MVDRALRPLKARLFAPLTVALVRVPADTVTLAGVAIGLAAAALAAYGRFDLAVGAWWLNRILDGLDGELARAARRSRSGGERATRPGAVRRAGADAAPPSRGAYLDLMADLLVYVAVPLGLAAGATGAWTGVPLADAAPAAVWAAAAAAMGAYYINLGSWALLSALLPAGGDAAADAAPDAAAVERASASDGEGADRPSASATSPGLAMPGGLVEGTETIVLVSLALLWPAGAAVTLSAIALLTLASAAQRTLWGARALGRHGARARRGHGARALGRQGRP